MPIDKIELGYNILANYIVIFKLLASPPSFDLYRSASLAL